MLLCTGHFSRDIESMSQYVPIIQFCGKTKSISIQHQKPSANRNEDQYIVVDLSSCLLVNNHSGLWQ